MNAIATMIRAVERFFEDNPEVAEDFIQTAWPTIAMIPRCRVQVCRDCGNYPCEGGKCLRCSARRGTITMDSNNARLVATMAAADGATA